MWEVFRVAFRMTKKPILVGGIALMAGYFWAFASRMPRPVSIDLMGFHRKEQMEKLQLIIRNMLKFKKIDKFRLDSK